MKTISYQIRELINEKGYHQTDTRMDRQTRALNGLKFERPYALNPVLIPPTIKEKYKEDWIRMYPSYRKACKLLTEDSNTRRAMIFNTTHYDKVFPCFCSFHVMHRENGEYDLIIYQRSSDLEKIEDDVTFFEYVMAKVNNRANININKIIIFYGSVHYTATE